MKKWNHFTLKLKLILSFSLATFLGFCVMGGTTFLFAEKLLKQLVQEKLETEINGVQRTLQIALEQAKEDCQNSMERWSAQILPKISIEPNNMVTFEIQNQAASEKKKISIPKISFEGKALDGNALVDRISQASGEATTLFVKTSEGLVRVSTSLVQSDGSRAVGTVLPTSSPVYEKLTQGQRFIGRSQVLGHWYISAYEPILQNGQLVGAFFLGMPETSSEKIRQYLKTVKFLKTGYYFILDSNLKMLLHPAKEGQDMTSVADLQGRLIFKEIQEQKNGTIEYNWLNAETKKPQEKLALFRYLPELNWYVSASINKEEAEEALGSLKWTSFLVTGISVLTMILLSFFMGSQISTQLSKLSERLLMVTRDTAKEAEELAHSSESLSSAATESAASLEETVASLEEINSQVQNNLNLTKETNTLGKRSLDSAQAGVIKLKNLREYMVKVQEDSKRVQEISSLIDDIAFQTNLLALNASVEAARAGEHGRGFAVVADAVRNLAGKSAESAKQITQMIAESSERIEKVVNAGHDVDASFTEIVGNIQKLSSLVDDISRSSDEQADGVSQISKAMNQLDSVTQNNSHLAENISGASAELSEQGKQLYQAVSELTALIQGAQKRSATASSAEEVQDRPNRSLQKAA